MSHTAGHNSTENDILKFSTIKRVYHGVKPEEAQQIKVSSPNGTVVVLTADPITGGIKVEQRRDGDAAIMSAVPLGLGALVLDGRTE